MEPTLSMRVTLAARDSDAGGHARSLVILSWYDSELGTWRASAPDFAHLSFARASAMPAVLATRAAAIAAVREAFADYEERLRTCTGSEAKPDSPDDREI